MNREREIFAELLEIDCPEERARRLEEACGSDLELRREVAALIQVHNENAGPIPFGGSDRGGLVGEGVGSRIGPYKLLEVIGQGGFGTVYMADQRVPVRRRVALKIIKVGMDTREVVARFDAERQALATMDHPNITKVFDAGATETGRPYFVMELVRGVPLLEFCDGNRLNSQARLNLFVEICSAIQHAHQKAIIHRDLKPANVLVTMHDDRAVPKVIDFGIAKALQQDLTEKTLFTRYHQFLGTPAYMSPEQAQMSRLDIDTRSDVYALGVLLYELLTGKTPFDGKTLLSVGLEEMLRIIREEDPPKPSTRIATLEGNEPASTATCRATQPPRLIALLRGDLDWIVMKCLEKDRTRRYQTVTSLAADVRRHLENQPVVARPPSRLYRLRKAWRRNKVVFTAAAISVVALLVGSAFSTWQAVRATLAKAIAVDARELAEGESVAKTEALKAARRNLFAADMVLAHRTLRSNNLGRCRELLLKHRPRPGEEDLRGWAWRYLWRQSQSDELELVGRHAHKVSRVAYSPEDGTLIASASKDGEVSLWNTWSRRKVGQLDHGSYVWLAEFSRDGVSLLTVSTNRGVCLWRVEDRTELRRDILPEWDQPEVDPALAVSPVNDRLLATGSAKGKVALWDISGPVARLVAREQVLDDTIRSLAFSADGRWLAVGEDGDGKVAICATKDLQVSRPLPGHANRVSTLAFSPDGRILATGGWDDRIILWNTADGAKLHQLEGHDGWIGEVEFAPGGATLLSAGFDNTIRFWKVSTGEQTGTLLGHDSEVWTIDQSPDGRLLVSGDKSGAIRLWRMAPSRREDPVISLRDYSRRDFHVRASDGSVIITGHDDEVLLVWRTKDLSLARQVAMPVPGRVPLACSSNGILLAYPRAGGGIRIWDTNRQQWEPDRPGPSGKVTGCLFSPGGSMFVSLSAEGELRIMRKGVPDMVRRLERHDYSAPRLALSPDGRLLAIGYEIEQRGHVQLWNVQGGARKVADFAAHTAYIGCFAFSPDGRLLASGSHDGTAKVWSPGRNTELIADLRARRNAVNSLAFSPDGRRLAMSGDHGKTTIWDTTGWQELLTLDSGRGFVTITIFVDADTLITGKALWSLTEPKLRAWRATPWSGLER